MFHEWPESCLDKLAGKLSERSWLVGDGFKSPPNQDDYEFWSVASAISSCDCDSTELFTAVHEELEVIDATEICDGRLYLGETSGVESDLALRMLGIRGIVVVTDCDCTVESIAEWTKLPTHPVTPVVPLAEQLSESLAFMRGLGGACFVCSSNGDGTAAALCAASVGDDEHIPGLRAVEQVEKRRGPVRIGMQDLEDIIEFQYNQLMPPPPPPRFKVEVDPPSGEVAVLPLTTPPSRGGERGGAFVPFTLSPEPPKKTKTTASVKLMEPALPPRKRPLPAFFEG